MVGVDVEHFELADLPGLPVMATAGMMDDLDEVFTDPRPSAALVERALAVTTTEPAPILDEYVP